MAKIQSVKRNFVMNFILQLSTIIFPLITFPYVSRILLAEGNGRLAFVTSVVSYFTMFAMLGIPTYGIRQVAKVRHDKHTLSKTIQEIFYLNTVLTTIVLVSYIISIFTIPRFQDDATLFYLNIATFVLNVIGMDWVYKGLEQYQYITVRSLVFKILSIVLMFVCVHNETDVVMYGAITIFAAAGSSLLNFINIRKFVALEKHEKLDVMIHLKPTFSFFLLTVSISVYTNLDAVMLGWMTSNEAVGYYSAATKIKAILVGLVTSLGAVLLPRLTHYYEQGNEKEFIRLTKKSISFLWVVSIPMTAFFTLFAQECIRFLSGELYDPAVLPMQVIMPTLIFIGLTNLMGWQILVPTNREKVVVQSVTFGAVVNVVINALLIPSMSATGASIGTLIAEFAVLAYQWVALREFMSQVAQWKEVFKVITATIISSLVVIWLPKFASPFIMLVVASLVFFVIYGILLLLLKESFIMEYIGKVRRKHDV